jgi:hypothetical protein
MLKREVCGGDFEATLDRTLYGMNYGIDWGFPEKRTPGGAGGGGEAVSHHKSTQNQPIAHIQKRISRYI